MRDKSEREEGERATVRALRARIAELERDVAERDEALRLARAGLLAFGGVVIHRFERRIEVDGRTVALLPREYAVLVRLVEAGGEPVSHERLQEAVWGAPLERGTNDLDVHVSRLRAKVGGAAVGIVTERGRGYRLTVLSELADSSSS
jgi:two-component system OmpR family response regulator